MLWDRQLLLALSIFVEAESISKDSVDHIVKSPYTEKQDEKRKSVL